MAESRQLKAGQLLYSQGTQPDGLYLLHSGTLEILIAPDEFEGMDPTIIISRSRRVGIIKGKSVLAGFTRLFTEPRKVSLRALETAQVVKYPLRKGGLKGIVVADISQTATLLKNIFSRINQAITDLNRTIKLYQHTARVNDNLHLIYRELSLSNAAGNLDEEATRLHETFRENGGAFPSSIDINFVIADNSNPLNRDYDLSDAFSGPATNLKFLSVVRGLLKLNPEILKHVLKGSPEIALNAYDSMTDDLHGIYERMIAFQDEVETILERMFGSEASWSQYLVDMRGYDEWMGSGRLSADFLKNLLAVVDKIDSFHRELFGKSLEKVYPGVAQLRSIHDKEQLDTQQERQASVEAAKAAGSSSQSQLKKAMGQIFEFALIDKEEQKKMVKLLNDFKETENPFNTDSESRKVRRQISKSYWEIFKQTYVRSKSESTVPRVVRLMMNYGFLDDELLDEDQLVELNELARQKEHVPYDWVITELEFLDKIYMQEEEPSITEMGQNYEQYLREQEKHNRGKVSSDTSDPMDKVMFEVNQRLTSVAALCSGSTATAFPILNSYNMKGSLNNFYISKRNLSETVNEIIELDYSAFYRETVLKMGDAREIIQEEIIPYFILLPIFGTKTFMWQELIGTNKRSRGRIFVPIFFMGDLKKSLAEAIASFRWELNRTMKGGMWADPIEGGVTGEYFDYVNTYKKNSRLSQEAKERIKQRFKSLRTNRDRFADDYITWLFYEKDGIMKMNTVVREIFFKNVPFRKEVREQLEQMPAYTQIATRFKNISARNYTAYERKFKKYQDENGNYPEEIRKYMDFLKM